MRVTLFFACEQRGNIINHKLKKQQVQAVMNRKRQKGWNRFKAKPVNLPDGSRYDSQAEYQFEQTVLTALRAAGEIQGWQRQKRISFPCGITWKIDYWIIIEEDKGYYVEIKGGSKESMREYKLKIKCFLYHYDEPIYVIKKEKGKWKIIDQYRTDKVNPPI
jgi:hypothetical protein